MTAGCLGSDVGFPGGGDDQYDDADASIEFDGSDEFDEIASIPEDAEMFIHDGDQGETFVVEYTVELKEDIEHAEDDCIEIQTLGTAYNGDDEVVAELDNKGWPYAVGDETTTRGIFDDAVHDIERVVLTHEVNPEGEACEEQG